ncbi:MAG: hypothetical protein EU535_01680 [Promethearchaeota archaeon]|nr:MAG: hypothetical protein EU535_01680 [Candidatus Lokiarchaeota archaeon]
MEIIKYLGDKLSQQINISPPAARGLLKLSIKDELGPFIDLNQINYNDLCNVLHNSLKERLNKLEISNIEYIISYLLNELTLNQSLITIAGV